MDREIKGNLSDFLDNYLVIFHHAMEIIFFSRMRRHSSLFFVARNVGKTSGKPLPAGFDHH
jgi:hypothetical protein